MRDAPLSALGAGLVAEVLSRFAAHRPVAHDSGATVVVIPALHLEFGDILIDDDDQEITVYFGRFTHVHFGSYDEGLTAVQKHKDIVDDVCRYLNDVFSDRIEFFTRSWGGGCGPRSETKGEVFVWSSSTAIFNS